MFSLVWKELQEGCNTKTTVNQKLALMQFPVPALRNTVNDHQGNYAHFFKTLQNRILEEKKDFHRINQFPSAWSERRRISVPWCFP